MKGLIKDALIIAGITLALLAGAELVLRLVIPESGFVSNVDRSWVGSDMAVPDPVLGYKLKPNHRSAEYGFNSLGYRGKEFSKDKGENVFRILCLGGSTTIGSNAGCNEYSYPSILEEMFSRILGGCSKRVEVINAGVFGYHSWHSQARLALELEALKPDMLVIMDGLNDVVAAHALSIANLVANSLRREQVMAALVNTPDKKSSGLEGLMRLRIVHAASWVENALERNIPLVASLMQWKMRKFGFEENLEKFTTEATNKGIPVLLVNYPWISREGTSLASEKARNPYGFSDDNFYRLYQFGRVYVRTVHERLSQRHGIPLVNPQPLFDEQTQDAMHTRSVFSDNMHFTRYGNYLLAKTVLDAIVTLPSFLKYVSDCAAFPRGYDELDVKMVFKDIFQWVKCNETGQKGSFCLFDALPKVSDLQMDNVRVDTGSEGWSVLSVENSSRPGTVHFSVDAGAFPWGGTVALPRVKNPEDSIRLNVLANGEKRTLMVFSKEDGGSGWTPIKHPVPVALPAGQSRWDVELVLSGQNAQFWTYNYTMIFLEPLLSGL